MANKEVGAQMEKIYNEINLMKQRKDELKIRNETLTQSQM